MRKFLASTFVLTLFAMAFAGPPIDYQLTCGEGDEAILIGVLSLTEGKVHVALVAGAECADSTFELKPDNALTVAIDWTQSPPTISVTIYGGDAAPEDVALVIVPQVAIDGMANAQRLRAAAMEMRQEAYAKREAAREGRVEDVGEGEEDDAPAGPPADVPRGDGTGGPPADVPRGDGTGKRTGGHP